MSRRNLTKWLSMADETDRLTGMAAFREYHKVMLIMQDRFDFPLDRITAAFVALSPNTDYVSNLRSLVSVLHGVRSVQALSDIVVSTYNHNRNRAYDYVRGFDVFDTPRRGRKIRSFYRNILDPDGSKEVTVDGHIVAMYRDQRLTMKEAQVNDREYSRIERAMHRMAKAEGMRPCQLQAVLWFTRKRVLGIKIDLQMSLFPDPEDQFGIIAGARTMQPYGTSRLLAPKPVEICNQLHLSI